MRSLIAILVGILLGVFAGAEAQAQDGPAGPTSIAVPVRRPK